MAHLGCHLDYILNELESRNGGHTHGPDLEARRQHVFGSPDLEAGWHMSLLQILRWEGTLLIWVTPSAGRRKVVY